MIATFTGVSSSGKSEMAENFCMKLGEKRLYIATMRPYGDEAHSKIARHKDLRAGKGFDTVEEYRDVSKVNAEQYDVVLLECISTLTANKMFEFNEREVVAKITNDIKTLSERCKNLVVISSDVAGGIPNKSKQIENYIKAVSDVNIALGEMSDIFIESSFGIANILKGKDEYEKYI